MYSFLKKGLAMFLAMMMMVSLGACGNGSTNKTDGDGGTKETTGEKTAEGTETEDKKEPVTINITWWGGQARHDYTQALLDKYTELNPHITFQATPSGWDGYFDKLATNAASGSMPDIAQMDYLYISTYANNNSVADMQEYVDNGTIDVSNINSVLYNSGNINGRLAGVVLSSSLITMGCNPDVFNEAGIEIPKADWTWDDFKSITKTIKEKTGKYGYSAIMADDTNQFNYFVRQHGAKLFSDDNKSLGYEDDQIYVDFLKMQKELIEAGAMPNPDEYEAIKGLGHESGPVVTGEGAMVADWSNYAVRVESVNENIELLTPPYGSDGTKALWVKPGMFFSVAEQSKVKQEAAEFINWFINSEEANAIILAERGTPVSSEIRTYMSESGVLSQKQAEMLDYVDQAIDHSGETPNPDPAGIAEVNEVFSNIAYKFLYERISAETAAEEFRNEANDILGRNN